MFDTGINQYKIRVRLVLLRSSEKIPAALPLGERPTATSTASTARLRRLFSCKWHSRLRVWLLFVGDLSGQKCHTSFCFTCSKDFATRSLFGAVQWCSPASTRRDFAPSDVNRAIPANECTPRGTNRCSGFRSVAVRWWSLKKRGSS